MPSLFDAAMAAADAVIGGTFGEDVLVTPMRGEDGWEAAVADPSRPAQTLVGVFTREGGIDRLVGTRQGTEPQGMSTLAIAPARIWFSAEVLAELPHELVAGDRITLVERRGQPSYAIARREPSDLEDATFTLTKA